MKKPKIDCRVGLLTSDDLPSKVKERDKIIKNFVHVMLYGHNKTWLCYLFCRG